MENAIWRIIDVNFNRAREGARVVEEYARFALNSQELSAAAKQLRHELSAAIGLLDQGKMLSCRDTLADVGVMLEVEGQLKRTNLETVFSAAAKRLPEALRALSETIQVVEPSVALVMEKLRYQAYDLEKKISLKANAYNKYSNVLLYVLLDENLGDSFGDIAKACIAGGVDCLQLRAKQSPDNIRLKLADELVSLCKPNSVVSIINDRVDIALSCGADGVHFGQDDVSITRIRAILTSPMILGLSTHNTQQLCEAIALGADYVGLGPTFTTETKQFDSYAGLEYLAQASEELKGTCIGHTAIGGINPENLEKVLSTGIKTVAVCSAVTSSSNPEQVCKKLKDQLVANRDS